MVNTRSGRSAHAGLLINGSQQVLYDPAGTFTHPDLPRRGDVHYGMTPRYVDYYERYHARFDYFVEAQKVPVSRAAADQLIANAQARGQGHEDDLRARRRRRAAAGAAVPGRAARASSPRRCARTSPAMPGVEHSYVYETDIGKNRAWERSDARVLSRASRAGRAYAGADNPAGMPMYEAAPPQRRSRRRQADRAAGRRISTILVALAEAAEGERISFGDMVDAFDAPRLRAADRALRRAEHAAGGAARASRRCSGRR